MAHDDRGHHLHDAADAGHGGCGRGRGAGAADGTADLGGRRGAILNCGAATAVVVRMSVFLGPVALGICRSVGGGRVLCVSVVDAEERRGGRGDVEVLVFVDVDDLSSSAVEGS